MSDTWVHGLISIWYWFFAICKVIKKFKENSLKNHANYTLNDNIRKRKSIVLQREEKLHEILNDFHNLDYES